MVITNDIKYIGVNDRKIDLFEGQYKVPEGMAYNSYVILDSKIAVFDTVDKNFNEEWLGNLKNILGQREPDYLVVSHMEPDHSANILSFLNEYPKAKIIASEKAFMMMSNFFHADFSDKKIIVSEGDIISLGKHVLKFFTAPMVHWPEVIVTYDMTDKVLFSADAFGKFGAIDASEEWACEARRYYFGIVGKYGIPVQNLLKKVSALDIEKICPLHGPVLTENLGYYISLYNTWSSYQPEEDGIMIAYTSVYGNTKSAVLALKETIEAISDKKVTVTDLARCDMAEAVEDAFRYSELILATTTYNGDIFPFMRQFITELTERGFSNRTVGFIENGSWAPTASRVMKELFSKSKNITFLENEVKILSAVNEETIKQIGKLVSELCKK